MFIDTTKEGEGERDERGHFECYLFDAGIMGLNTRNTIALEVLAVVIVKEIPHIVDVYEGLSLNRLWCCVLLSRVIMRLALAVLGLTRRQRFRPMWSMFMYESMEEWLTTLIEKVGSSIK